jgi:hypothetical protein
MFVCLFACDLATTLPNHEAHALLVPLQNP